MISKQGLIHILRCTVLTLALLIAFGTLPRAWAQQTPPADHAKASHGNAQSSASGTANEGKPTEKQQAQPAAAGSQVTPASTMQIKRTVTGELSYRFITGSDSSAAPVVLPAPAGTDNIVSITLPSTLKPKEAQLEVIDSTTGKVAHLPVITSGVTPLSDSDFTLIQTVFVPVQVKGKGGLYNATITLAAGKPYNRSWLLKPSDNGVAQFSNVPLGVPVTATVSSGGETPVSQTLTLPSNPPADGYRWQTIQVDWPDAKATTPPPVPAPTPAANGTASTAPTAPAVPASQPQTAASPLEWLLDMVVSLLFLAAVAYGIFWAYKNGYIKKGLDHLGIQTQPVTATGPQGSPFDKPARAPIQPITEGTADPLAGGGFAAAVGMAPVASAGPRLVATMGTYAGSIFPLGAPIVDIGRDTANPIALPQDTNASRRHATIQASNGQYTVTDNGSSNGTFVNGVRITNQTPHPLRPGDELQVGMTRFRFEA